MDIVLSVIGRNVVVPIACAIRDNLAMLGQRTCRTVSACPYRRLVWWKNSVDRLIDKGDFHLAALRVEAWPCRRLSENAFILLNEILGGTIPREHSGSALHGRARHRLTLVRARQ